MQPRDRDAMWCLVLFDLPVATKKQRREAAKFRKLLIDSGYSMIQFSVYGKYAPSFNSNKAIENTLKCHLPADGEVRILHLTDRQWATATRFRSQKSINQEEMPEQFRLF